jgi:hypothetical protein
MADVQVGISTESKERRLPTGAEIRAEMEAKKEARRQRVDRALAELQPVQALVKALKEALAAKNAVRSDEGVFSPEARLAFDIAYRLYNNDQLSPMAGARAYALFLLNSAWDGEHFDDRDHTFRKAFVRGFEVLLEELELEAPARSHGSRTLGTGEVGSVRSASTRSRGGRRPTRAAPR